MLTGSDVHFCETLCDDDPVGLPPPPSGIIAVTCACESENFGCCDITDCDETPCHFHYRVGFKSTVLYTWTINRTGSLTSGGLGTLLDLDLTMDVDCGSVGSAVLRVNGVIVCMIEFWCFDC